MRKILISSAVLSLLLSGCGGTNAGEKTGSTNHNPVAKIVGGGDVTTHQSVNFDASQSSDEDGDALSYVWKNGSGQLLSTNETVKMTFQTEGDNSLVLTVTDPEGGSDTETVSFNVKQNKTYSENAIDTHGGEGQSNSAALEATAVASATTISSGETVHFTSDTSSGPIDKYEWYDMDGNYRGAESFSSILVYRAQYDNGHGQTEYRKTLYVFDADGGMSHHTVTVLVNNNDANQDPIADLGDNLSGTVGDTFLLRAGATDADGVIDNYVWKNEAGEVVAEGLSMETYEVAGLAVGTHTFTVTVTDNDGATATDEITIVVTAPTGATGGSSI